MFRQAAPPITIVVWTTAHLAGGHRTTVHLATLHQSPPPLVQHGLAIPLRLTSDHILSSASMPHYSPNLSFLLHSTTYVASNRNVKGSPSYFIPPHRWLRLCRASPPSLSFACFLLSIFLFFVRKKKRMWEIRIDRYTPPPPLTRVAPMSDGRDP
jgi:hypothetical protein